MNKILRYSLLALFISGSAVLLLSTTSWAEDEAEKFHEETTTTKVANVKTDATPIDARLTSYSFDADSYNFGEVKQNKPAKHTFWLTNTGNEDLIIETVKPSCSCTASNYTKDPIAPGEKGYIELEYSAKKLGVFRKSATITANTDPRNKVLSISGEVVE